MPPLYLLHPAVVHFPIALLSVGLAGAIADTWSGKRWAWLADAVSWLLWLGTVSAWAAGGLGLLAERSAPHVPPAWQNLDLHETLAYWTIGSFIILSLWRWRWGRWKEGLFLVLWLGACGILLATAYQGGELVFTHGMGVQSE